MTPTNPPQVKSERPTFTDLMRARTHFIIDPIVTVLARLHVKPDLLSVVGSLAHILFAYLIATGQFMIAGIAVGTISPIDALDGALARKLGREQGGFGAFLDSTLDRIAELILFAGFLYYYHDQGNLVMMSVTYAAIGGSLLISYSRARAEALGLSCKVGILGRVERYILLATILFFSIPDIGLIILAVLAYITVFQRGYHVWKQTRSEAN